MDTVLDVWQHHPGPVVADADALTILAAHTHTTPTAHLGSSRPTVRRRLLSGSDRTAVEANRFEAARDSPRPA